MEIKLSEVEYKFWILEMWMKGYGTSRDVDSKVRKGEIIPGQEYPDLHE